MKSTIIGLACLGLVILASWVIFDDWGKKKYEPQAPKYGIVR